MMPLFTEALIVNLRSFEGDEALGAFEGLDASEVDSRLPTRKDAHAKTGVGCVLESAMPTK